MKALVMWADESSRNLGVRVLAQGAEALIRRSWPEADVEFQSFGNGAAPFPLRERTVIKELLPGNRAITRWVREYDFILDMRWGDSFSDIYGLRRLVMMNTLAQIAAASGSKVIMGPQTIGPFESMPGRILARLAGTRVEAIMCRDARSAEYCEEVGLPFADPSTDVVFALPVPDAKKTRDIAVNVSGLLSNDNPHIDSGLYRRSMVELCKSLLNSNREVTLFAHVLDSDSHDNDVPAVKQLQSELDHRVAAFIPAGLDDVREFVASADLVVGARMHACLNALSTGTPAIPLAYSRKFSPLLEDLGWQHTIDLRRRDSYVDDILGKIEESAALEADIVSLRSKAEELLDNGAQVLQKAVGL